MIISTDDQIEANEGRFRLTEFEVSSLFDEHNYLIPLRQHENVTAIIAPNGAGKTLCLRMINGLFRSELTVFAETQYDQAAFRFSDKTQVIIKRILDTSNEDEDVKFQKTFILTVIGKNGIASEPWQPQNPRIAIERHLPFLRKIGPQRWRNAENGEIMNQHDIISAYGDALPANVRKSFLGKLPEQLLAITDQIDCHLIETQRLLVLRDDRPEAYYGNNRYAGPTTRPKLAIAKKAEALKATIAAAISEYASLSQTLDRSFPRRVIEQADIYTMIDVDDQLELLDTKRRELMSVGILDTEADEPPLTMPAQELSPQLVSMLAVYATDTSRKLATLAPLLARTKLFKKLIDERFGTKDVRISRDHGIDIFYKGKMLPLDRLSSGEQHQLVLFFELLFEIGKSSLILIDEPELSLHVAWQKKFISDLKQIIALNHFDVVLATHSPQLIGRWSSLVVELGDVYGDDDDGEPTAGIKMRFEDTN